MRCLRCVLRGASDATLLFASKFCPHRRHNSISRRDVRAHERAHFPSQLAPLMLINLHVYIKVNINKSARTLSHRPVREWWMKTRRMRAILAAGVLRLLSRQDSESAPAHLSDHNKNNNDSIKEEPLYTLLGIEGVWWWFWWILNLWWTYANEGSETLSKCIYFFRCKNQTLYKYLVFSKAFLL